MRESGTLCSFNLENNTSLMRIKKFDPRAYATSLGNYFMPTENSWRYIYHLATVWDYVVNIAVV